ncbi:MAG TPA: hypothetical protein VGL74_12130 [Terriglobales bacterium]|jgi:hypothetical protein
MSEPNWQALYSSALAETDARKLEIKIEIAQRAIHRRLDEIRDSHNNREGEQLDRALHALFTLAARKRSA